MTIFTEMKMKSHRLHYLSVINRLSENIFHAQAVFYFIYMFFLNEIIKFDNIETGDFL